MKCHKYMILNNKLFLLLCACLFAGLSGAGAANAAAPASATVTYNLFRNGVQLGVITEQFEARDGVYRATSEAVATGFFALVQREPIRYVSNGTLTRDGLRPQRFEGYHRGKTMFADFDWPGAKLNLTHDGLNHAVALPPGAQDRLSIMYQLMFSVQKKTPFMDFAMTNGRKLEKYRYTAQPDVTIDTPFKRLNTIHLVKQREADDTGTEIWIAPEFGNVPVKVLIIEDDGVRYEQVATHVEVKR
jgi:Protein of unknown function (DUF3108)